MQGGEAAARTCRRARRPRRGLAHPPLVGTRRPPYLPAAEKLRAESIEHKVWMEQPENIPTAIALKPCARSRVAPLLKKYSLFK